MLCSLSNRESKGKRKKIKKLPSMSRKRLKNKPKLLLNKRESKIKKKRKSRDSENFNKKPPIDSQNSMPSELKELQKPTKELPGKRKKLKLKSEPKRHTNSRLPGTNRKERRKEDFRSKLGQKKPNSRKF